jgi:hypothetical protein
VPIADEEFGTMESGAAVNAAASALLVLFIFGAL